MFLSISNFGDSPRAPNLNMQKSKREAGHEDMILEEAKRNKCHRAKRTSRTLVQILSNHTMLWARMTCGRSHMFPLIAHGPTN